MQENLFFVVLEINFYTKKVQNRPRFSNVVTPIELEFSFTDTRDILGCLLFLFQKTM